MSTLPSNALTEVRKTLESDAMRAEIKKALPSHVTVDRFVRITVTAVQKNPDLISLDRVSLYGACMAAAQAGLLPDGRESAIVPFKGKAQFMPMVEGLMKQVRNSGELANISVQIVCENDEFDYELGDNERMVHKPALKNRGEIVGAYSIATLKNGEKSREWMDIDDLKRISARGAASGPWKTDPGEMCRKTVFRRHYKRLPKSTDLDESLMHIDDEALDVANGKSESVPAAPVAVARTSRLHAVVDAETVATETEPVVILDKDPI